MKKQTKRIKQWVNEYSQGSGAPTYCTTYNNRKAARGVLVDTRVIRVAVPLIELRRGEVVVDVEALVKEFEMLDWNTSALFGDPSETLRAALKKVGVR